MKKETRERNNRFTDLGLSADIIKVLSRLNFVTPTPIQAQAIPAALEGKDVLGIAQTGTGKTLAFFLPMLQNIKADRSIGLVVAPTRELALQVQEEIDRVGKRIGLYSALLIGGANMERQIRQLKRGPHVIVATPGRLIDHLERRTVKLDKVSMLVLDEADRMLDMGFAPQIDQILKTVPDDRQTLLFSATMPEGVTKIAHSYMQDPVRVEVAPAGSSSKNVDQGIFYVDKANKFNLLLDILNEYKNQPVLVFSRTKHGTKKMTRILNNEGFKAEELHSNRTLNQRRKALDNFKKGKANVMVATDVAARGIDVKEIALVINYDIPEQKEDYVHRIGRTGRAGHKGEAVTFVEPEQYGDMEAIKKIVDTEIPALEAPGAISPEEMEKMAHRYSRPSKKRRGHGRGKGGRGRRHGSRPSRPHSGKGRRRSRR